MTSLELLEQTIILLSENKKINIKILNENNQKLQTYFLVKQILEKVKSKKEYVWMNEFILFDHSVCVNARNNIAHQNNTKNFKGCAIALIWLSVILMQSFIEYENSLKKTKK